MANLHVRRGDTVLVIAGKDKGKTGKVLIVNPSDNSVVVEGVNIIHKHKKAKSAQDKGGIIKSEAKIHVSNVQLIDPVTKKATRVYNKVVEGNKVRVSKDGNVLGKEAVSKKAVKKAESKTTAKASEAPKATKTTTAKKETTAKPSATKTAAAKSTTKAAATPKSATTKTTATKPATSKTTPRVRNQER